MRALGLFALAAALTAPAAGQINTERMGVGADEPGWSGAVDVNASWQRGNTEREILGAGIRLQYAWPRSPDDDAAGEAETPDGDAESTDDGPANAVSLTSNYSFTRLNGRRFTNDAINHLRFMRRHGPRISFEVFGQHQFNEFTRLEERILLGGGGRFALLRRQRTEIFLGAGYMFERETLDLPVNLHDPRRSEQHRSTNYLAVRHNSEDERLRLVQTLYAQPSLDRLQDLRLRSETSFELQLFRRLAVTINLNVAHDSEPPPGIKDTDIVLSNSLRYSF